MNTWRLLNIAWQKAVVFLAAAVFLIAGSLSPAIASSPAFQQGTPAFTTFAVVTAEDEDHANVRSGPGLDYPIVGVLRKLDRVPALGRSPGGDWVQVVFPDGPGGTGWVYSFLLTIEGTLSVVEPPATSTPLVTPTVDQTLASQFIVQVPPTRLPTFTPPPPLTLPEFHAATPAAQAANGSTMVYLMLGLAVVGVLGFFVSLIRTR